MSLYKLCKTRTLVYNGIKSFFIISFPCKKEELAFTVYLCDYTHRYERFCKLNRQGKE